MMRPVAVIHVDSLRREYPADWLLATRLEASGYRTILTSRTSTPRFLQAFTPDVVVLSHVFSISPALLASLRRRGVRLFVNEVEGEIEGNELGISGTYPEGVTYEAFERIFTWSDWSRRWLIEKRGLDPAHVQAVGSIRSTLLRHFAKGDHPRRVGILARFETLNFFDGRHPFHNLARLDLEHPRGRMYFERTLVDMETFAITAQVIDRLVRAGIPVTLRPHPNEDTASYRELKDKAGDLLEIDAGIDYLAWLEKVAVVVGPFTSAYTEPYLLRIPIVAIAGLQQHQFAAEGFQRHFVNTFTRACHHPKTLDELVALCADPALQPVSHPQLDCQLAQIYSLNKPTDPIEDVCAAIGRGRRTAMPSVAKLFAREMKVLLDLATLTRSLLSSNRRRAIRRIVQYDFNSLIHRPTASMHRIERRLRLLGAAR